MAKAPASYAVPELARVYNFPTDADGSGQCVGIIALGAGYRDAYLRAYFDRLDIPMPDVRSVLVGGARGQPGVGQETQAEAEVTSKVEIVGAVAPRARIVVYVAPNTNQGYRDAIAAAVGDTENKPSVILSTWGAPEPNWTDTGRTAINQALQTAATRGITVCCGAGDGGSDDGVHDGRAHVDFPASSPYVLAVGGTHIDVRDGAITREGVWGGGDDAAQSADGSPVGAAGAGGGVSDMFALPEWQSGAGVPPSVNPDHHVGRGMPDVAAHADPAAGYQVFVYGSEVVTGGTGPSAALWAGLIALINQKRGKPLGFVNPLLYRNYRRLQESGALRQITEGSNGAYSADPGWNACTGLGVPDGAKLAEELIALTRAEVAVRALSDAPTTVDRLGFADYADALADFIRSDKTTKPLTLAIDAPWGMGKTSLMKMIEERLRLASAGTQRPFVSVWFDAWKYEQEQSLWAALALRVLDEVRRRSPFERARFALQLGWERRNVQPAFHWAARAVLATAGLMLLGLAAFGLASAWPAGPWAQFVQPVHGLIGGLTLGVLVSLYGIGRDIYRHVPAGLGLRLSRFVQRPDYQERVTFLEQFQGDFKRIIKAVTGSAGLLAVFIDDLDRCTPDKTVEVVEAINLMLPSERCVFVIGMDMRFVAVSVEAKYKDATQSYAAITPTGELTLGQQFLEKFVQIAFHIPTASELAVEDFIRWSLADPSAAGNRELTSSAGVRQVAAGIQQLRSTQGLDTQTAARTVQQAKPEVADATVREAVRLVEAESFDDSPFVVRAMTAMAPYLELNPRKIKRFINVYRLQAFIAWRRNLLQFEDATALAAAVVIAIRWPSAVGQTLDDPALLGAIKRAGAAQREHAREQLAGRLSAQDEEEYQRLIATYGAAVKMLCGIEDFIRLLNGLDDMELTKVRTFLRLTQLATPIAPEVGEHQTAPAARRTRRRPSERSSGSVVASSADGARARPEATGDQPSAAHLAGEPPPAGEETATTEATPTESEASAETPPVTSPTAASPSATSTESAVPTGPRRRRGSAHG